MNRESSHFGELLHADKTLVARMLYEIPEPYIALFSETIFNKKICVFSRNQQFVVRYIEFTPFIQCLY